MPVIIPRAFQKEGEDEKLEYDPQKVINAKLESSVQYNCEKALCGLDDGKTFLHKAAEVGDCLALDACIELFENGKNGYSEYFGEAIIKCLQIRNEHNHTPIDIDQGLKEKY